MTLEAVVFQRYPFSYGLYNFNTLLEEVGGLDNFEKEEEEKSNYFETRHDGSLVEGISSPIRRKRRRTKIVKNKEEVENHRMNHIIIERNRRKQMNDYLAVLRSLMPSYYLQRGDQASIVEGAINFVKELEQLLQSLEGCNRRRSNAPLFSDFFSFPQYSSTHILNDSFVANTADVEVSAMVESHVSLKILLKTQARQLIKMVTGLPTLGLTIIHLNVTTVEDKALYSFSLKVEDDCRLSTVNEVAAAVYDLVQRIQEEAIFSS